MYRYRTVFLAGLLVLTALLAGSAEAQIVLEGCGPGYWREPQHFDAWVGVSPSQTLESLFNVPGAFGSLGNRTLLEALHFQGGPAIADAAEILLRTAVASLLSAAHPDVDFPLTVTDVITRVSAALASGDRSTILALASQLKGFNSLGCPLA